MTPSVFIIDDDAGMRDSLVALLRSQGIRCRAFAGGADFFRSMPQDETACVVTDLRMPEVDGAEVVRRVTEERGAAWPILVITAHADVSVAVSLMKKGVVDFIEKPFDPQRLIESVRSCLASLTQVGEGCPTRRLHRLWISAPAPSRFSAPRSCKRSRPKACRI